MGRMSGPFLERASSISESDAFSDLIDRQPCLYFPEALSLTIVVSRPQVFFRQTAMGRPQRKTTRSSAAGSSAVSFYCALFYVTLDLRPRPGPLLERYARFLAGLSAASQPRLIQQLL